MFQSFSGSSRRPRQVNLSGQDADPFAGWGGSSVASGTKKTVAHAQQERQHRKHERDRLQASKRIQRTWRGYRTRREVAQLWRDEHDSLEHDGSDSSLTKRFELILYFFDPRHPGDILRLRSLGNGIEGGSNGVMLAGQGHKLVRLAEVILKALEGSIPQFDDILFMFLIKTFQSNPNILPPISLRYYSYLSQMLEIQTLNTQQKEILRLSIQEPLQTTVDRSVDRAAIYWAFGEALLTNPKLTELLNLDVLARAVDIDVLSRALISPSVTSYDPDSRLWQLAHFIWCHRATNARASSSLIYMNALSVLLSNSAAEIVGRIDAEEQVISSEDEEDYDQNTYATPLPRIIREQLVSLVDKDGVTGLLARFNLDYNLELLDKNATTDASSVASYALLLLRIFPKLGEEIRMWFYQGSVPVPGTEKEMPALLMFWDAVKSTQTFKKISEDSISVLSILKPQSSVGPISPQDATRNHDWRAILLFLELYAFVLRFTDDEEFLSGGDSTVIQPGRTLSRSRESALALDDVKSLIIFLKNLSFTMFFNAAQLMSTTSETQEGGLGNYFGASPKTTFSMSPQKSSVGTHVKTQGIQSFVGIPGMTFNYVRGIVNRVLRMLYERDSRRRFLPKDHWLMTSRFDMAGFIPAVVAEEERQHEVNEDGVDTESDLVGLGSMPLSGSSRARQIMRSEQLRRQQQLVSRNKVLAAIGPRLEVLQNMPFVIPFETRVQIFRQFVYRDQMRRRDGTVDADHWRMSIMHSSGMHQSHDILSRHHAKISRDQVFEDAFKQFYELKDGLKEPIQITFVDKFGSVEAGIDGGGVTKEFLTSVTNEAFRSTGHLDMFVTNDQNLLYPNPAAVDEKKELLRIAGNVEGSEEWREPLNTLLKQYEFLGRIIGKCLYEGILVDISFAGFFLIKWASSVNSGSSPQDARYLANINDLRDLDESLYQGLLLLKDYTGDVSDFSLDFTINDTVSMPGEPTRTITRELLPNGSAIAVTNENRVLYVSGVARHRLHSQPFLQTRAFLRGLADIINPTWLAMFNQTELQTLIGGDSSEIDIDDLRRNTSYGGVYVIGDDGLEHPSIQCFWKVMKQLNDGDRRKVLRYVTSTPRAPLLGFSQLNPRFSIRDAGSDEQRLPSTSTCINLLKLPRYTSVEKLREKLVYAINSGAGFDLS